MAASGVIPVCYEPLPRPVVDSSMPYHYPSALQPNPNPVDVPLYIPVAPEPPR